MTRRILAATILLFLLGCESAGGPGPTAERRDACANSYGPGTAGLALCLKGVYEP